MEIIVIVIVILSCKSWTGALAVTLRSGLFGSSADCKTHSANVSRLICAIPLLTRSHGALSSRYLGLTADASGPCQPVSCYV